MSKYEQLISKAMSTESSSEAYACLQMAKKHKPSGASAKYEGHTAEEWAKLAANLELVKEDYRRLYTKYADKAKFLQLENESLGEERDKLKMIIIALGAVCFFFFIFMAL